MKRNLLTGIILAGALHFSVFAQDLSDEKYQEILTDAETLYLNAEYRPAIPLYEKINKSNHNSPEIEYKLGICYLWSVSHNELAREHLEKALQQGYNTNENTPMLDFDLYHNDYISSDINYSLGRAYQLHLDFDKAIEQYNIFKARYETFFHGKGKDHNAELKILEHIIETAHNGKKLVQNPITVKITNLGDYVNSEEEDIAPLITADEQTLFFTSRRAGSTGGKIYVDGRYMEDIYISTKDANGNWKKAQRVSTRINTAEHDAAVAISPDGSNLILYKNNHHGTGDLYSSVLEGYTWSSPVKMNGGVNTKYLENSATISADKQTIYFVSNRPHGFGGQDIYMCKKQEDDTWGPAVNLGDVINTPYDEESPFIHTDGQTLYFSSKGHSSMGGYDIFKTSYNPQTQTWSKPENLGYPINTPDNDVFFVWSPDGKRAYFSSHHEDSFGDQDIYMMELEEQTEKVVIVLKGLVREKRNQRPLDAEIHIRNNDTNEDIAVFHSSSFTGKYTIILPANANYAINVTADGFIPASDRFDLPKTDQYYEKELNFDLEKKDDGSLVELKNVFFENNKADLNESAYAELDKFVELLNEHPEIQAEIAGHTEPGGIEINNEILSQQRAQAVTNYITSKGISKRRVKAVGYGSKYLVNKGLTEEEKEKNRRTEIIIHHTDMEGKHWKPYYSK